MYVKKVEKQIKEVDVVIESYDLCDKCDKKIEVGFGNAFDFSMTHKTGSSYPESGYGEKEEIDLCQDCAEDLMETLKEMGYRINKSDWDY